MALPEHVKRQAMSAVAQFHNHIEIHSIRDMDRRPGFTRTWQRKPSPFPRAFEALTPEIKMQAMSAVAQFRNAIEISIADTDGLTSPPPATAHNSLQVTQRIAEMVRSGMTATQLARTITKDGFDRAR